MTLYTEKEAAEKWCPFTRAVFAEGASVSLGTPTFNRFSDVQRGGPTNPPSCRCIGSRCMAWRWHDYGVKRDGEIEDGGYCGAFGKVERRG